MTLSLYSYRILMITLSKIKSNPSFHAESLLVWFNFSVINSRRLSTTFFSNLALLLCLVPPSSHFSSSSSPSFSGELWTSL